MLLGKEIYSFFFVYGKFGMLALLISTLIIGLTIFKILKMIKKYEIESYDEFLDIVIDKTSEKTKTILKFIVNISLLVTFFVMCAGITAFFKQELGISPSISSVLFAVFCFYFLNKDIKGLISLNWVLIPIIILIAITLGIKAFEPNQQMISIKTNLNWVTNSIIYASFNSIALVSILIPMKNYIKGKKDIFKIVISCILIIMLIATAIIILLISINDDISKIELPAIYAAGSFGESYKYIYGLIILGAIATTAISSAYGFLENIYVTKSKYMLYNFIICVISVFVTRFGFSNLVNNLYPIFGFLGLIQLIFILKCK